MVVPKLKKARARIRSFCVAPKALALIDDGPNCLYKDGHVANAKNLSPEGSSEYEKWTNSGNIYKINDTGTNAGKGKDTVILRGSEGSGSGS